MKNPSLANRRQLKSRDLFIFRKISEYLTRKNITPNYISFSSIVFAAVAALALVATNCFPANEAILRILWIVAIIGIQLRLLANMLDGMVAVEGGKATATGPLWNEFPDRISDILIFIGAGYALGGHQLLGFGAALMSVLVAYTRAIGADAGAGQCYIGPQAKQHRMALMTLACLILAFIPHNLIVIKVALWIVILGGALTVYRRLYMIRQHLRKF